MLSKTMGLLGLSEDNQIDSVSQISYALRYTFLWLSNLYGRRQFNNFRIRIFPYLSRIRILAKFRSFQDRELLTASASSIRNLSSNQIWSNWWHLRLYQHPLCCSADRAKAVPGASKTTEINGYPRRLRWTFMLSKHTRTIHGGTPRTRRYNPIWGLLVPWLICSWSYCSKPTFQRWKTCDRSLDIWWWVWYLVDLPYHWSQVLGMKELYSGALYLRASNNSLIYIRSSYRVKIQKFVFDLTKVGRIRMVGGTEVYESRRSP